MTILSDYEKEQSLTHMLITKYGAAVDINVQTINRIYDNKASETEIDDYIVNSQKLTYLFKKDLRSKEPEQYSDQDIDIIMAMVDANHRYMNNREMLSKVLSTEDMDKYLSMSTGKNPQIAGCVALSRHTENLSPQQTNTQLGLDSPNSGFMYGEVKSPFISIIKTPISNEILDNIKLPIEPRHWMRIKQLAEQSTDPDRKQRAKQFVARHENNLILIVRNKADEDLVRAAFDKDKIIIRKAYEAPYTGTTAPFYTDGDIEYYASVVQENYMDKPTDIKPGTIMSVRYPKADGDPEDPVVPADNVEINVAKWDGKKWVMLVKEGELEAINKRILSKYSGPERAQIEANMVTSSKVRAWVKKGNEVSLQLGKEAFKRNLQKTNTRL